MKLPIISHNQRGCWLKLCLAFMGLSLIPVAMGGSNCTKSCFESLCNQPNGTEVHDHSYCLNANMNCNCSVTIRDKKVKHSTRPRTFREYAFLAFIYYLLFVSALIAVYLLIILFYYVGQYCGFECNWCRETINFVAGCTWIREPTNNTTGSDSEISMSSQPSDSQTGSPQSSSGSSIVIPMDEDESQFPLPEDDLPPEYHHPPQYPHPPEYTCCAVDVVKP